MDELILPAPAKLNLMLNILGRRADGFHELQTVFQLIDLTDTLSLKLEGQRTEVETEGASIPMEENLVFRAAERLRNWAEKPLPGVAIRLTKRIPSGAGLGGGSSDAATTLLGLARLWGLDIDRAELMRLGARLGADVPVFLAGTCAFAEGIGERLQPIDLPEKYFVVVYPGVSVPTARVFQHPDLTRNGTAITIARFLEQGSGPNACESLVRRLFPPVDEASRWLSQWGPAKMTGSGSCVFLGLDSEPQAQEIAAAVPPDWLAFVAKGINTSPLHGALNP